MRDAIKDGREIASPEISGSGELPARSSRGSTATKPSVIRCFVRELAWRVRRNWVHEIWDWACCGTVKIPSVRDLRFSIAALDASDKHGGPLDREAPIFLLATGWRSGSTLLQRILVTDPHVLLWGEPLKSLKKETWNANAGF